MSAIIPPSDWPANMRAEDRKVWLHEQITKWVDEKKIEECLSALELGNLSMTQKAVAYRSILIVGSIRHCRMHASAEARMPILILITYLSDNAKGTCSLSITKMQELLKRSRQCIVDNILALEAEGLIGVERIKGMPNRYWPRIPAALVEMSPNPVWVIDALTTIPKARIFGSIDEAIAAATETDGSQTTGVDRSSRVDHCQSSELDRYRSSTVDPTDQVQQAHQSSPTGEPVKSSTDSISSLKISSLKLKEPYGGANAPRGAQGFSKHLIWKHGLGWLISVYAETGPVDPDKIRGRLGALIKEHGQGKVLHALVQAEQAQAIDPLNYVAGILGSSKSKPRDATEISRY